MRKRRKIGINRKMKNISKRFMELRRSSCYKVKMLWDSESNVWVATSDDIPGLVLESESLDTLVARTKDAIPELLELNGKPIRQYSIAFQAKWMDTVVAYG